MPLPRPYDAVLLLSFGGPEGPDEVRPFLEKITQGKSIPAARIDEVAQRYALFGGVSPLGGELRAMLAALVALLNRQGPSLPVYWGNRNWHPFVHDTIHEMAEDGIRRALVFATSAFGSYPSCRQYQEDLAQARAAVGASAPELDKLRLFFNHPGFIEPMVQRAAAALAQVPVDQRDAVRLLFSAHSIPLRMAERSPYVSQLRETCGLVGQGLGRSDWELVYQSRSGPPAEPWLVPHVCDRLAELGQQGDVKQVVVVPVGFLCEHMETVYDLDVEAADVAEYFGIRLIRAATIGAHPALIEMIRELILERVEPGRPRRALGDLGPWPDECPADCCGR